MDFKKIIRKSMGGDRFPPRTFTKILRLSVYTNPYITAVLKERNSGFAGAGPFTVSTGVFFSGYSVP